MSSFFRELQLNEGDKRKVGGIIDGWGHKRPIIGDINGGGLYALYAGGSPDVPVVYASKDGSVLVPREIPDDILRKFTVNIIKSE